MKAEERCVSVCGVRVYVCMCVYVCVCGCLVATMDSVVRCLSSLMDWGG